MAPETVITLLQRAFEIFFLIAGPLLIAGLLVGLIVSIFQAATQINEAALSFIPKLLTVFIVLLFAGQWMLNALMDYTTQLYESIPTLIDTPNLLPPPQ